VAVLTAAARHFLALEDHPDDEIAEVLEDALRIAGGDPGPPRLAGRVLGLVFLDPSLRTRTSFEVGMLREGGHAVVLEPGRGAWPLEVRPGAVMDADAVEHLREAAGVLGRYVDALAVRAFPRGGSWAEARRDAVVRGFAEHSGVPVVNLESARRHPCQELGDGLTLRRALGDPRGRKLALTWAWHPRPLPVAVPNSAALAAARAGMEVTIAHPPGFELDPEDLATIREVAARHGGSLRVVPTLEEAVQGADAVYAKSWGSLAHVGDAAAEAPLRAGLRAWRVDEAAMARTRDGRGRFLHCLPVRRNVEVTDGVLDGPWSSVLDQAENRLHAQRALLRRLWRGSERGSAPAPTGKPDPLEER
jgi:N-acetylornithine carbamoyltransferase